MRLDGGAVKDSSGTVGPVVEHRSHLGKREKCVCWLDVFWPKQRTFCELACQLMSKV